MKYWISMIGALLWVASISAQDSLIGITTSKTTSLIFPCAIRHIDRGGQDVLVQTIDGAENILLVKAASHNFPETNLSVVTEDGIVYSINVGYKKEPEKLVHRFVMAGATPADYARMILDNPKTVSGSRGKGGGMEAGIIGVYVKQDLLFIQLSLENRSAIDFDMDGCRIFTRDKKAVKHTAIQEVELLPKYVAGNTGQIAAGGRSSLVVAIEKVAVPVGKNLMVEVRERVGGRHLLLKLGHSKILRATPLPDLK